VTLRRGGLSLLLVLLAGGLAIWALLLSPYPVMPEALAALESDDTVTVTTDPWLTFAPTGAEPDTGIVLYTGARVPPDAYAPLARAVAAEGYLVVLPELPLNLAVLDANAAVEPMAWFEDIDTWAVGGHSLGGAMAARLAGGSADVDGLVLLAAYPEDGLDLTDRSLTALVALASEDEIADQGRVRDGLGQLPPESELLEIDGGNHAGFGWYGAQPGDGEAFITRDEQTAITADAIGDLLADLESPP
jgi:dienelactone hydrolase